LISRDGKIWIKDLGSANGTFLNDREIQEESEIRPGDRIQIGSSTIRIKEIQAAGRREAAQESFSPPTSLPPEITPEFDQENATTLRENIHRRLIEQLDLKRLDFGREPTDEIRARTREVVEKILNELADSIPPRLPREKLAKEVLDEALGLGPLEDLLADPEITEVMVNRKDQIYIERQGKLFLSDRKFSSDRAILNVIERIVSPLGRRIDESSPMVDARLKDGSRVNAIIPPLAIQGPTLTIRKFSKDPLKIEDLVRFGALTREMADFLRLAVQFRKNIIISGGTGSGKTTLLNVLSSFIPRDERIVTIEDAAELRLPQEHIISLEARPPNIEGKGAITIRELVRNALRMRPDRIVVGECRGGEALDMLQAMNTGHDGSLTTGHANSPRDILARLETMVLMSGMELPVRAIREQIASAINLIVQQARFRDGTRKITHITEVQGMEGDIITLQDIFVFKPKGYNPEGKVLGEMVSTGFVPRFIEELREQGETIPIEIFRPT
jgi:pilus assembly protein CpaF